MRPMVCRRKEFKLSLDCQSEDFISTPQPNQRNWVVRRAMDELADDLSHLDRITRRFVTGSERVEIQAEWSGSQAQYDDSQLIIEDQQVMQDWEHPYMKAMAEAVTRNRGDVLEIGFGMGISASYIQEFGVDSYTVIECNEGVRERFAEWQTRYPDRRTRLVFGPWQDRIGDLGEFDGIFFDTYASSEEEYNEYVLQDVTYAAHFFEAAAAHLRPGGIFTYYSNEIDSVSRRTQRRLFDHFGKVSFSVVRGLKPPEDCNYWWADSMVVVEAVK